MLFPQLPGDADLFVSDQWNPVPQFGASNWSCVSDYTEVVQIPLSLCPVGNCVWYASATPWYPVNTTYSIVVQRECLAACHVGVWGSTRGRVCVLTSILVATQRPTPPTCSAHGARSACARPVHLRGSLFE